MSKGERVCWTLVAVGVGMMVAPVVAAEALQPLGDARFALVFIGAIVALASFLTWFFLRHRSRVRHALQTGQGLLAHWSYADAEWRAFAGDEERRQADWKRALLGVTAVIMAVVTAVYMVRNFGAGLVVGAVLAVTWGICWFVVRFTTGARARLAAGGAPEVRIGADGLLIGEELHCWRGWGQRFETAAVLQGPPLILEIAFSRQNGAARVIETIRVPVPEGRADEAVQTCARLRRR